MHLSDLKDMLLLSAFLLVPHSHMPGQRHGMIAECVLYAYRCFLRGV